MAYAFDERLGIYVLLPEEPMFPDRGVVFVDEAENQRGHKLSENVIEKEGHLAHRGTERPPPTHLQGGNGGAKNRITLLKHLSELSARERNAEKLQEVVDRVIELALIGNESAMALVWKSVMTNGAADDKTQARDKVEINITSSAPPEVRNVAEITVESESNNV